MYPNAALISRDHLMRSMANMTDVARQDFEALSAAQDVGSQCNK
jgi:hypothetical protein